MLWYWWNLVYISKIGWENLFCQYFCIFFSIFRENRDFWLKKMIYSDLDMFTQFKFEATIFELKQIQIVFEILRIFPTKQRLWVFQIFPWFFCRKKWFFSDLDMFTQFKFEATIFMLKQIQIVFWNPENISNKTRALDFSNLSSIF